MDQPGNFDWFDEIYRTADGESRFVPWARNAADPGLSEWLRRHAPKRGARAIVVGCGLGDDAEAVAAAGWVVVAFDVSPVAIEWCRRIYPASAVDYETADVFGLPNEWRHSFDLVVELRTVQSLPLAVRAEVIGVVGSLVAPGGVIFAAGLFRSSHATVPSGPPWAVSESELTAFEDAGLRRTRWHAAGPRFEVEYTRPPERDLA